MQTLTKSGTTTDYIDKAIYEVSESEIKTKFDEETMKKSRKENDLLNFCVSINLEDQQWEAPSPNPFT